jgi:hypothetical protein
MSLAGLLRIASTRAPTPRATVVRFGQVSAPANETRVVSAREFSSKIEKFPLPVQAKFLRMRSQLSKAIEHKQADSALRIQNAMHVLWLQQVLLAKTNVVPPALRASVLPLKKQLVSALQAHLWSTALLIRKEIGAILNQADKAGH